MSGSKHDFLLGVNYWPARQGLQWWEQFTPEPVSYDLELMRKMGLNCVRVFLRWQDFQTAPDRINEQKLEHFDQVLALARFNGLGIIPTLFTGHMSGENWDVSWRGERSPYNDPCILRAQLHLIHRLGKRYGQERTVIAWDLANEHDNFVSVPDSPTGWLWAHLLTRELETVASQPVLLGTHITSFTRRDSFRFCDLGELHNELCVHPYPMYSDLCPGPPSEPPATYFPSYCIKLARGLGGRPGFLEEFGISTTTVAEKEAEQYFRVVLPSALAAGATGALAWCFADFDIPDRLPYATTPYEIGFGLTRAGKLKGPGRATAEFASGLKKFPWKNLKPAPAPAAILLPARYYEHPEPEFTPGHHFATLFAAFVLAKQAGLEVDFIKPGELMEGYGMLICPCIPRRGSLDLPFWGKMVDYVRRGGCLYLSYAGVALPDLEKVFGIRHLYPDVIRDESKPVKAYIHRRMIVRPTQARVLKPASDGKPLALANKYGAGHALLVTEPVEHFLASAPHRLANNSFYPVYRHLALAAGIDPVTWVAAARRQSRTVWGESGRPPLTPGEAQLFTAADGSQPVPDHLVLVNHSGREAHWPNPDNREWLDNSTGEKITGPVCIAPHRGRLLQATKTGHFGTA